MHLKSYLRGIGLGMIVTACVLHFTFGARAAKPMTDEQIKAEARKLGMIENTVLSVNPGETEDASTEGIETDSQVDEKGNVAGVTEELTEEPTTDLTEKPEENSDETPSDQEIADDGKETPAPTNEDADNDTTTGSPENQNPEEGNTEQNPPEDNTTPPVEDGDRTNHVTPSGNTVKIQVVKGDSSNAVAEKLFAAGVIDNAYDFDRYLCENKLDKNMIVGEFEVKIGTSYKDLARMLSSATIND